MVPPPLLPDVLPFARLNVTVLDQFGFQGNINVLPWIPSKTLGTTLQGGFSTGRTLTDNCEIFAKVPEAGTVGATNALDLPQREGGLVGQLAKVAL